MISRNYNLNPVFDARPRWQECLRSSFGKIMKTLISAFLLLACVQLSAASEIPPWHVIKGTARGTQMLKIVEATWEYEAKFKKRPPNLIALVTKGILKEEDLCLKNLDGSLAVPDYYPDPAPNVRSEMVVIRASSEDGSYQIIVRKDLSIGGVANKNPAEQDGTGQPATRPKSDSEVGDKPKPESEGNPR